MAQAWFSHGRNLGFGIALPGFSKLTFPLYFFAKSMVTHGLTMVGFTMVKHVKLMMSRSVFKPWFSHGLSHGLSMF